MNPAIFISYRRDDATSEAILLAVTLQKEFGHDGVFLDTSSIRAGSRWPTELERALKTARVLLVVIGPEWLTASNDIGKRRIDQKGDWVRRELEVAFSMDKPVVPVLVRGAKALPRRALPRSISELVNRQNIELRNNHWNQDVQVVLDAVRDAVESIDQTTAATAMYLQAAPGDYPVTISGRKTEVHLVEGDGNTVLEPHHIRISLRATPIDPPDIIAKLKRHMVEKLETSQPPIGGVAMWNSKNMAALTGYRRSRTPVHEHIVMDLDMNVSDYATFAATVLSLDSEIEKVTSAGLLMRTTLRHEYFPTPSDVSRAVNKPVPFLANGVGVVLLAFTDDDRVILTRRRDSSRARPGQRDVSVVEGIHTIHDAPSSERVDVYMTAIRACREELGVSVSNNDVQLLGFGVDMKYYQWNFFGSVELRCTTAEVMELHAMNAKDRWEGQLEAIAADPVIVFEQLYRDDSWDTALVATFLAFCKRIGVSRTRSAAARVFGEPSRPS